jgi:hypothetical protein
MVMASIFVQIPAYHDLELARTIKDCLKKSSGKHTINFGIHLSYFQNNDIDIPISNNIKFSVSLAPKNIGVGIGRYLANKFYNGEDYYLQIDSHMRFGESWDDFLINTYLKYKSMGVNPAISAYPGAYEYEEFNLKILNTASHVAYTDFVQELSFQNNYVPHQRAVGNFENNVFSRSVSAASIFASGEMASIEPNKNMFFWGEEILTAMRLHTHGFDIMLPESQFFYHLYYDHEKGYKNLRRQVREDFPEISSNLEEISQKELSRIVTGSVVGDQELGSKRSLKDYEAFAGINFIDKKIVSVL